MDNKPIHDEQAYEQYTTPKLKYDSLGDAWLLDGGHSTTDPF